MPTNAAVPSSPIYNIKTWTGLAVKESVRMAEDSYLPYRVSGSTHTTVGRSQLLARWPGTHSRILSGTQRAAQTVLGVHLKRTCSRVTSASSALGVFNDYALYKSTHSLTHREKWRKYVHGVASHRKRTSPIYQRRNYSFLGARGQKQ